MQLYFEDVNPGDEMTPLEVEPTTAQLFFFSAATYNSHRIHYDRTWAVDVEGHQDVLVQGPLQAALLARAITDWAGAKGRLVSYGVQNRASAYPGEQLRFVGTVEKTEIVNGRGMVTLTVRGEKDADTVLMPGHATVELPRKEA
jgi:hydroxyacyl-ACP dehydratase HTD2-like protein with hotdog domain